MFRLTHFLAPFKKQVILGPIFKLAEAIFELMLPIMMMKVIDIGIANHDTSYITRMIIYMVLICVVKYLCALVCQYYAAVAAQGVGTKMRSALFTHIQRFSYQQLDRFGTSSLINRVTNDVNQLQWAVAMLIRLVIRAPFLCIGGFIMAFWIDARLSMILLGVIAIFSVVLYLVMSKSVPLFKNVQKRLDALALVLRENLSGVRVIRAFARVGEETNRFDKTNNAHAKTAIGVNLVAAIVNPVTTIVMNIGILMLIWFGGRFVNVGQLTQGQIIALINYVIDILAAMIVVANLVVTFTKAAASATRVNEVLDTVPAIADAPKAVQDKAQNEALSDAPALEFNDVCFRYEGDSEDALSHINFTLMRGQTLGVIGGTGSGKSTLLNLIPRFYDVSQGAVTIDGVDVRQIPQRQLRQRIGVVPQRARLFSGTIRDNLLWRNENADDADLARALELAQAPFVLELPQGLDTPVSQGGVNFSGGQKQRLSIARALVGDPAFMLLDDAASALDYRTDAQLRKALRSLSDTTVVIVSQRASAIAHADQILVLDDGKVVGQGTHEQLLQTCTLYQEICHSQQLTQEVGA